MHDKKKTLGIIQVVFFLVLLGAGSCAFLFGVLENKTSSELEKRELKQFPKVRLSSVFNGDYESEFNEALSDHFYGRDFFVTVKTWMEVSLGMREIDGVYIDDDRLIELYKDSDFDEKQIAENISDVTGFMATVSKGIGTDHVKMMLVPSKCSLYRDRLPNYIPTSNRADSIASELRESLAEKLVMNASQIAAEETDDTDDEDIADEEDDSSEEDSDEDIDFDFEEGDPDAEEEDSDESIFDDEEDEKSDQEDDKKSASDNENGDLEKTNNASAEDKNNSEKIPEADKDKMKTTADGMVVDLRKVLLPHTDKYIYYRTDHHWTTLGASFAYDLLSDEFLDSETKTVADDFLGTDYNKTHYYSKYDEIKTYIIPQADQATMEINDSGDKKNKDSIYDEASLNTADKYNYYLSGNYSAITVHTGTKNGKTLLLVKDSYSNSLVPFLCRDYETIIMVDLRYVNGSVYDYLPQDKQPDDVLIVYNEEKFMQDTHQGYLK